MLRLVDPRTLESIHKFMKQEAEQKWGARLMRKSTIETALTDYNAALDDAARGFQASWVANLFLTAVKSHIVQIATLISIHLAVGDASTTTKADESDGLAVGPSRGEPSRSPTLPPYASRSSGTDQEVVTDVQEIVLSPISRSATVSGLNCVKRMQIETCSRSRPLNCSVLRQLLVPQT